MASPLLVALVAAILVAAVLLLRTRRANRRAAAEARAISEHLGRTRVNAQVHTGWEQTLIGLARELRIPRDRQDAAYGELYFEPRDGHQQYVRTRSEIGRGFLGVITSTPHPGPTSVDYSILRLPSDEALHARVLQFERDLIAALRRFDHHVTIDAAVEPLLPFESPHLPD